MDIQQPKSVVNLKNVPEVDRTLWCLESQHEITDQLGNADEVLDWIVVHRMKGFGNFIEMHVQAADVVTVTDYT